MRAARPAHDAGKEGTGDRKKRAAQRREAALALAFPRRCPACGRVLGAEEGGCCAACAPRLAALGRKIPRIDAQKHDFYALGGAAAGYEYRDEVRYAILACKRHAHPWYARELADLTAGRVFGITPPQPGKIEPPPFGLPLYDVILPVPPRQPRSPLPNLPLLLARRLGRLLDLPVETLLTTTRPMAPQKSLRRADRLQNTRGAYACRKGADLSGRRVLLVDDIITTGATVSACALAALQAGAESVFAVAVAVEERGHTPKGEPK